MKISTETINEILSKLEELKEDLDYENQIELIDKTIDVLTILTLNQK